MGLMLKSSGPRDGTLICELGKTSLLFQAGSSGCHSFSLIVALRVDFPCLLPSPQPLIANHVLRFTGGSTSPSMAGRASALASSSPSPRWRTLSIAYFSVSRLLRRGIVGR